MPTGQDSGDSGRVQLPSHPQHDTPRSPSSPRRPPPHRQPSRAEQYEASALAVRGRLGSQLDTVHAGGTTGPCSASCYTPPAGFLKDRGQSAQTMRQQQPLRGGPARLRHAPGTHYHIYPNLVRHSRVPSLGGDLPEAKGAVRSPVDGPAKATRQGLAPGPGHSPASQMAIHPEVAWLPGEPNLPPRRGEPGRGQGAPRCRSPSPHPPPLEAQRAGALRALPSARA